MSLRAAGLFVSAAVDTTRRRRRRRQQLRYYDNRGKSERSATVVVSWCARRASSSVVERLVVVSASVTSPVCECCRPNCTRAELDKLRCDIVRDRYVYWVHNNNINNNPTYRAPECRKTSVALKDFRMGALRNQWCSRAGFFFWESKT